MVTIEDLKRQLERERLARKEAERILEEKSLELYQLNKQLLELNNTLEQQVVSRTVELQIEKAQLDLLLNKHPMPLVMVRKSDLLILDLNEKATQVFDCSKEKLIGENYTKWAVLQVSEESQNCSPVEGERAIQINGLIGFYSANSSELSFHNEPIYLIVLCDLSKQKFILNQSIEKENAYKELVETVSDIIYRVNEKGLFLYVNPTAIHVTGYKEEELINTHFTSLVSVKFKSKLMSFYNFQMKESIQSTYIEFPIVAKSGREIWVGQTVDLHKLSNGKIEFIALCRDISDRKKAEKALILSEDKYRSIIENLELGLLEVDKNGIIVKAYPQFCHLTGYTASELEGKIATELLVKQDSQKILEGETMKRKKGIPSVYELELLRKDGKPIWVMISGAPFYNERNEIAGTVGIHLDISARKKMEEELILAKEIAEKSLRSKDVFVANMSHEIRTPLNAIIGMSRLLADSGLTEKQHNYIKAIQTSSENLLAIVNDLLDFAKLEAGKMELELIPANLKETIQSTIQLWELKIDEKGLVFEKNIDHLLFDCYQFDPTRLSGILTNLLHNALKFTKKGKLQFNVRVEEQFEHSDRITFEVKDTGIGISHDKLTGIFESFVQAESNTTRNYGGTGLGLSIAKDLVQLMGGVLLVHSEVDIGSTFYFTLDLIKSKQLVVDQESLDLDAIEGVSILLVEDNQINRFMAQTILEQWKVNVTCAENGGEAVDLLKYRTFDLILMDMQMPVLDGLQATWMIRNKLKINTPIIALTANAVKGELEKCMEVGMNGFVSKPFTQEELQKEMNIILKCEKIIMQSTTTTIDNGEINTFLDLTLLHRNTNNDANFMKKMVLLVIDETTNKIKEMEVLLSEKNSEKIGRLAHSMKPSIDHVAIQPIRDLLREVEAGIESFEVFELKTLQLITELRQVIEELKTTSIIA